jgi:hypothetical protein
LIGMMMNCELERRDKVFDNGHSELRRRPD